MKKILIFFLVLFMLSCKSKVDINNCGRNYYECKGNYNYKKETTKIENRNIQNKEVFDSSIFDELFNYKFIEEFRRVVIELQGDYIYSLMLPKKADFANLKVFDRKSKKIKKEGLVFGNTRFRVGIWKFYDEQGYLSHTIDYDSPFLFALEDVLTYCKQYDIDGKHSEIDRFFQSGKPLWSIKIYDDDKIHTIILDGENGSNLKVN